MFSEKDLIFLGACILATKYEMSPAQLFISQSEEIYDLVFNKSDDSDEDEED